MVVNFVLSVNNAEFQEPANVLWVILEGTGAFVGIRKFDSVVGAEGGIIYCNRV